MDKRSAVCMALTLTGALIVGGIALASGVGGPAASDAAAPATATSAKDSKPIVQTKTRTVTIHRKAKQQPDSRVVVLGGSSTAGGSGSSVSGSSGSSDDETSEDSVEHESEGSGDDPGTSSDNSGSGAANPGPGDGGEDD